MKKLLFALVLIAVGGAAGWLLQPVVSDRVPEQAVQTPASDSPQGARRGGMMRPTGGETVVNEGLTVDVITPDRALHAPHITLLVSTHYLRERPMVAKSNADVSEVFVRLGDRVQGGDLLMRLTSDALMRQQQNQQLAIEQLQANDAIAQLNHQANLAALADANKTLAREQSLAQRNLGTDAALNNAQSAVRTAQLTVDRFAGEQRQRQAQLEQARLQLADINDQIEALTITAPFAGVVSDLAVEQGDEVNTNAALLTVASGTEYRGVIAQQYGAQLSVGNSELTVAGQAAQLTELATRAEQGTLQVRFASEQTPRQVGQQQEAYLALPAIQSIALPISALYQLDHVFEVREGRLHQLPGTVLGFQQVDGQLLALMEIADWQPGTAILTTALSNASAGTQVQIREQVR